MFKIFEENPFFYLLNQEGAKQVGHTWFVPPLPGGGGFNLCHSTNGGMLLNFLNYSPSPFRERIYGRTTRPKGVSPGSRIFCRAESSPKGERARNISSSVVSDKNPKDFVTNVRSVESRIIRK